MQSSCEKLLQVAPSRMIIDNLKLTAGDHFERTQDPSTPRTSGSQIAGLLKEAKAKSF